MRFEHEFRVPVATRRSHALTFWFLVVGLVIVLVCAGIRAGYSRASAVLWQSTAFPCIRSTWNGFECYSFALDKGTIQIVVPRGVLPGKPWVWHSERLESEVATNIQLLGRGYHVVRLELPNLYGSPVALQAWDACYELMTKTCGLGARPALIGVSRGALFCYNWAIRNPGRVSCIVGDAAVCDLRSWPGCRGRADPSPKELAALMRVYGVTSEEELFTRALNPIDSIKPLATHGVPLLHIYGELDTTVPWEENAGALAEVYRELGGQCRLIAKPGCGHVSGLDDPLPIVEFIDENWKFQQKQHQEPRDRRPW